MFRRISLLRVTDADSVDLTSTVGATPTTVTSSATADWGRTMSTVSRVVVVRRMASRMTVRNPCISALTAYTPGGSAGNRKRPLPSVTADLVPIRFGDVSVTVT